MTARSSLRAPAAGSPVIALPPGEIPWASAFRSTWVVSSLDGLRGCGHFDRYQTYLGEHRNTLLGCIAGTWLPIAVAAEHYRACERLRLADDEYARVAKAGSQVRMQWNARVVAELQAAHATPWDAIAQLQRTWRRAVDGGAFCAFKLDEHQARATFVGCELLDIAYFRRAVQFMVHAMCAYKGKNLHVQEVPARDPGSATYLVTWK